MGRSSPVARLIFANALLEVQFWFPIWLYFLLERGFTLTEAVLADGLFRYAVVLFEVPLARVADRIGRRRALLLISGSSSVVFLAVALVHDMRGLLVVWIAWGAVWALSSGASGAYLYELVGDDGTGLSPRRALAAMRACASTAIVVSIVAAGHLFARDIALPFLVTASFSAVAFLVTLSLPSSVASSTIRSESTTLRSHYSSPRFRVLVLSAAIILLYAWSFQILLQPLLKGWAVATAGYVFALFALLGIVGHALAGRAWADSGRAILTGWVAMVLAVTMAAVSSSPVVQVVAIATAGLASALCNTLAEAQLLRNSAIDFRATTVSVVSLIAGIGIGAARPSLGVIADVWSVQWALAWWALVGLLLTGPLVALIKRSGIAGASVAGTADTDR